MYNFLMTIHVAACILLIVIVLLQAGRGAGLAIFGGGGDTLFASPTGSSALKKATAIFATTFALTSLMLTLLASRTELRSVTRTAPIAGRPAPPPGQAPAKPAPAEGAQKAAPAPAEAKK